MVGLVTVVQLAPFHRSIVPPSPTAHPSSELTIKTVKSLSKVGVATLSQVVSCAFTICKVVLNKIIKISRLAFKPNRAHSSNLSKLHYPPSCSPYV